MAINSDGWMRPIAAMRKLGIDRIELDRRIRDRELELRFAERRTWTRSPASRSRWFVRVPAVAS